MAAVDHPANLPGQGFSQELKGRLPDPAERITQPVTLIQRFGGSLNLNIHFHQLFVDGCYELSDKNEPVDFWVATPPTVKEIEEVLTKIIHKITKYLERQKIIIRDDNDGGFQLPIPDEDTLSKAKAKKRSH